MCRHQLPVWQEFYAAQRANGFEILSVSVDALGASAVRPWTERAKAEFTTVVDQENLLAGAFGFKAVPNGLLVDPNGILRFMQFGGFDIAKAGKRQAAGLTPAALPWARREASSLQVVESFIAESFAPETAGTHAHAAIAAAAAGDTWETHFQAGVRLLAAGGSSPDFRTAVPAPSDAGTLHAAGSRKPAGNQQGAASELRKALVLDPSNFLVRKQLWRTLHPDKFGEEIDLQWQKGQMAREAELGYEQANPIE